MQKSNVSLVVPLNQALRSDASNTERFRFSCPTQWSRQFTLRGEEERAVFGEIRSLAGLVNAVGIGRDCLFAPRPCLPARRAGPSNPRLEPPFLAAPCLRRCGRQPKKCVRRDKMGNDATTTTVPMARARGDPPNPPGKRWVPLPGGR
jgi:hypothetical protein